MVGGSVKRAVQLLSTKETKTMKSCYSRTILPEYLSVAVLESGPGLPC